MNEGKALVSKEELDEALKSAVHPEERENTLSSFMDTLQVIAAGKGHTVIDSAIDRISKDMLNIDRWVISIAAVFMMGIEIGLKIAEARAAKKISIQ